MYDVPPSYLVRTQHVLNVHDHNEFISRVIRDTSLNNAHTRPGS